MPRLRTLRARSRSPCCLVSYSHEEEGVVLDCVWNITPAGNGNHLCLTNSHTHIHTHTHTHAHTHIHTHTHMYTHTYTVHTHTCTHTCAHTTCTHIQTHLCTHTCAHTQTCTHYTDTPLSPSCQQQFPSEHPVASSPAGVEEAWRTPPPTAGERGSTCVVHCR